MSKRDSSPFDAEKHVQLARNDDVETFTCLELDIVMRYKSLRDFLSPTYFASVFSCNND